MSTILGDPEGLVAEVSRRAHHRAVELAEEARKRAAAILQDARVESESIRRESAEAVERQVAAVLKRNAARADLEAQRRFILLREAPLDRVWQALEKRLREIAAGPNYIEVLKAYALSAARVLGAADIVLAADPVGHELLSPDTLEQWSRESGTRFRRASEPAGTWGGLLASSGRLRLDATFPTRLAEARLSLREQVFKILSELKP